MLPDCSREYLLKKNSWGSNVMMLRRSIGKFQFLLAKPNPMPVYTVNLLNAKAVGMTITFSTCKNYIDSLLKH